MAWIWTSPPSEQTSVWVDYDDKNSSFKSSDVLSDRLLPADAGTPILRVKRWKMDRIRAFRCLPTTASAPVIHREFVDLISRYAGPDEVQFYPVLVKTFDDVSGDYSFVIPFNRVVCTDVEKSKIRLWIIPGKMGHGFEKIVHHPNCLRDFAIARDECFEHVLVSNELREALLATGDKGLAFSEPQDMRDIHTMMSDWRNHPGKDGVS
jgi:hypothetical protein